MLLQTIIVASLAVLASEITALLCTIGQEPDPASGNKYRWVIPVEDPCQCTHLGRGSLNTATPCRPFPVIYYDSFLFSSDPEEIRQWLNCSSTGRDVNFATCSEPLGMEDGRIADASISASTAAQSFIDLCRPHFARLNTQNVAWCPEKGAINPWIQVEFPAMVYITGVITQGGVFANYPEEWIKEYRVAYSSDGQMWHNVTDADGTPTTFLGNTDGSSQVTTKFESPLYATYIRIMATALEVNYGAFRFELLGCY